MGKSYKKRQAVALKQPAPVLTKKQIARSRKEAQQTRIIWMGVAGVGAVILAVLVFALIRELIIAPNSPVAVVNGNKISVKEFQTLLSYRRYSLHANIGFLESQLQTLDPAQEENQFMISFYQQQLQQLQSRLALAPEEVLDELIENELIRQKANELSLSVSQEEVRSTIQEDLRASLSSQATSPITSTEPVTTPTPIPQTQIDERYRQVLQNLGLNQTEYEGLVQDSLLRTKLQEFLASEVPTTGLIVHVQMIMTDTQEAAGAALARIQGGEDFATVAKDVSSLPGVDENGGDIGWVTTGQFGDRYGTDLEKLVFAMNPGDIRTAQSNEKFYVVQVLDRNENGPLPEDVLTTRQNNALTDWLEEQKNSSAVTIERLLEPSKIPPDPFETGQS